MLRQFIYVMILVITFCIMACSKNEESEEFKQTDNTADLELTQKLSGTSWKPITNKNIETGEQWDYSDTNLIITFAPDHKAYLLNLFPEEDIEAYGTWFISSGAVTWYPRTSNGAGNGTSLSSRILTWLDADRSAGIMGHLAIKSISSSFLITETLDLSQAYETHYTKVAYTEGSNGNSGSGGSTSDNSMYFTNFTWTATQTSVTVKFYTNERATSATIKYGENSASSSKSATITNKEISTTITGLKKGTKYFVKCIARNSTGSVTSEEYPVITNY